MAGPRFDIESQQSFWRHMFKQCFVRLGTDEQYRQRKSILRTLEESVRNGAYATSRLHGFLTSAKPNNVARHIPVFTFQDCAVYFACVKAIDEPLAAAAIPGTFGGFTLGGAKQSRELEEAKKLYDEPREAVAVASTGVESAQLPSVAIQEIPREEDIFIELPPSRTGSDLVKVDFSNVQPYGFGSFNKFGWVKSWSQYWKLAVSTFEEAHETSWFAMFDIANFYCSIDLSKLERLLRRTCPEETDTIEILMYFLSTWNRDLYHYAPSTKGIPMDLIGDCSRVLANFFLTPFDSKMKVAAQIAGADYLRFADDTTLCCPTREAARDLIFDASGLLHEIGLHINVAKVEYLTHEEYELHWGFRIMALLEQPGTVEKGLELLKSRWKKKGFKRKYTALRRAITILGKRTDLPSWRKWVVEKAVRDPEFLASLSDHHMRNLVVMAKPLASALKRIEDAVTPLRFSQPKAYLLACAERFLKSSEPGVAKRAQLIVDKIRTINDPVLDLAIKNSSRIAG
mgnify:CR=1 FL=1